MVNAAGAGKLPRVHEFEWQQRARRSLVELNIRFHLFAEERARDWCDTWQINSSRSFSSTELLVSMSESHEVYSQDN